MEEQGNGISLPDNDMCTEEYSDSWLVPVKNGYQGLKRKVLVVHSVRKPL